MSVQPKERISERYLLFRKKEEEEERVVRCKKKRSRVDVEVQPHVGSFSSVVTMTGQSCASERPSEMKAWRMEARWLAKWEEAKLRRRVKVSVRSRRVLFLFSFE